MTLRVIGAGFPRTGTTSLKAALERLLEEPCYHMREVVRHPSHAPMWRDALRGEPPRWETLLSGYAAAVDWPAAWFWRELLTVHPDALVILSRRDSAESWHRSMDRTVLVGRRGWERQGVPPPPEDLPPEVANWTDEQFQSFGEIIMTMNGTAFPDPDDRASVILTYERHLAEVRSAVPASRLLEWQPGDGWQPLCAALDVPVPNEPFPHENTTADFTARMPWGRGEAPDGDLRSGATPEPR